MFKRFTPRVALGPVVGGLLALIGTAALADDAATVKSAVAKALPDAKVDSVLPSPIPGLY